jgi:hypothetical protein
MIRIHIQDEASLTKEYLDKFKSLVLERIVFYQSFFSWRSNSMTYSAFLKNNVNGRDRKTLINKLNSRLNLTRQDQIPSRDYSKLLNGCNVDRIAKFLTDASNHINDILIGDIEVLSNLNASIYVGNMKERRLIQKMCTLIFDYESFCNKSSKDWYFSRKLAEKIGLNVCPYCNRNYITSVKNDKGEKIIGPTLDHFLPQHSHPLLRISFYNLIPSCTICNSNLKHKKDFDLDNFLYPYSDEMDGNARFEYVFKDFDIGGRKNSSNYHLFIATEQVCSDRLNRKLFGPVAGKSKIKGSMNVFKILDIYRSGHLDVVSEIDAKLDATTNLYAMSVRNLLGQQMSDSEFYQFYFGNYLNKRDWNRRPLSKLTYDLVSKRLSQYRNYQSSVNFSNL